MIHENNNQPVIVCTANKISRDTFDILESKKLCYEKNINIYDIMANDFVFNKYNDLLNKIMEKGSDNKVQRNLDVLYIEPNKLPVKRTIKNTLEEKQKLVGGLIEYTYLNDCDDIAIVCNEEHKLLGLPPNRDIGHDMILGNFFIVGDDPEVGEDRSLTEEQIRKYTKYFGKESIEKTTKKYNEILLSSLDI